MTFGTKILATGFEELIITGNIIGLGLRFDPNAVDNDLKAIQLKTASTTYTSKAYDFDFGSTGWYDFHVNVVGFETKQAMGSDGRHRVFTAIRPLLDRDTCTDITIDGGTTLDIGMTYDGAAGGLQTLDVDLLNEYALRNPYDKTCNTVEILSFSEPELVIVTDGTFKLEVGS